MTPHVKLGRVVTFMKYLTTLVSLIFLPKTSICNKITFPPSNLLNLAELVVNELTKGISQKYFPIFLLLSDLPLLNVKVLRVYN